jgi:mycothiol synthase
VVIHAGTLAGEPRVSALLSAQGYREVRRFWLMRLAFEGEAVPPEPPEDVDVRLMADDERTHAYRCLADAFQDHWGTGFPDENSWMHHHRSKTGYDPGLWWVAHDGAGVVGALIARPSFAEDPQLGYIAELGVLRPHRGRGIARALLRTSFAELQARGRTGAALHVDSESSTGATRLYESVGMTAQPRFAQWEKQLRPAG